MEWAKSMADWRWLFQIHGTAVTNGLESEGAAMEGGRERVRCGGEGRSKL